MISPFEIILRLFLGALFGGTVGYERQVHGRPAGFRTHLIVCVASVLLMITSEYYRHLSVMDPSYVRVDPGRIAAGAITGIGFLGAGVILKLGVTIQGLTTAASIWMVSAAGLALGAGLYLPAASAFGMTVFALVVLRPFERNMPTVAFRFLTINADEDVEDAVTSAIRKFNAEIHNIDYEKSLTGEVTYNITISLLKRTPLKEMMEGLLSIRGVRKVFIRSSFPPGGDALAAVRRHLSD